VAGAREDEGVRLTKYGHACVRLEKESRALVIDPGAIMADPAALAGAEAVLITHEHWDHFEAGRLREAAERDPGLLVYTCAGVARHLGELADRVRVVADGDVVTVAGFRVAVVGEKHHVSHPDVPPVGNVGFLVDDEVFHPGDALTVVDVPTLLVPGQAPWMTVPDLIRYLREVRPRRAYAIHDGLLNEWGLKVLDGVLAGEADRLGADVRRLPVGGGAEL
jgi:L-ascorbate metabolism protein UlaG (beta-lactamase superfamily)